MGENQVINNQVPSNEVPIPSLDFSSFDYNKLDELIQIGKDNQVILEEILQYQKDLSEYIIPSEDDLLKLKELESKKEKEELEKESALELEKEENKSYQEEYNSQVLQQLTLLNDNISNVEIANHSTNSYLYILCFGLLVVFVLSFIYKTLRRFF